MLTISGKKGLHWIALYEPRNKKQSDSYLGGKWFHWITLYEPWNKKKIDSHFFIKTCNFKDFIIFSLTVLYRVHCINSAKWIVKQFVEVNTIAKENIFLKTCCMYCYFHAGTSLAIDTFNISVHAFLYIQMMTRNNCSSNFKCETCI